jgi:hypothetical protein
MKQNKAKEIFYPYDSLTEKEKKRIDLYKDKHNVDYTDIHVYHYNEPLKIVVVCLKPIVTKSGYERYDESTREIQDLTVVERDYYNRIYIVESHGGQYEDSWDHIEGIFTDPDKALQHAKDVCDEYDIDDKAGRGEANQRKNLRKAVKAAVFLHRAFDSQRNRHAQYGELGNQPDQEGVAHMHRYHIDHGQVIVIGKTEVPLENAGIVTVIEGVQPQPA